ncbi:MAG: hypothetical protein WC889_11100 [Myxococcota bacterium]
MDKIFTALVTLAVLSSIPSETQAQQVSWKDSYPLAIIDRPLTNPKGMFELRGNTVQVNLSKDAEGKPVSLAPAIFYGITDEFTIGITTPVNGLCLTGDDGGCTHVFNDIAVDFQYYAISKGSYLLVPHGGVSFSSFQPARSEFNLAVLNFIQFNAWLALFIEPSVSVGLNDRTAAHPDSVNIPFLLGFQVIPKVFLFAATGIGGSLYNFSNGYVVPVSAGGWYSFTNRIDVGAEFQFTNLTPHDGSGSVDGRKLYVRLAARF